MSRLTWSWVRFVLVFTGSMIAAGGLGFVLRDLGVVLDWYWPPIIGFALSAGPVIGFVFAQDEQSRRRQRQREER